MTTFRPVHGDPIFTLLMGGIGALAFLHPGEAKKYADLVRETLAQICNWTEDFEHENGQCANCCGTCGLLFMGHKRRRFCKACAIPAPGGESEHEAACRLADELVADPDFTGRCIDGTVNVVGIIKRAWADARRPAALPSELPELPRAQHSHQTSSESDFGATWASLYTADQMKAYALAALKGQTK